MRREAVDSSPGYRNGHRKPRRVPMQGGAITVQRPRIRGLEERFENRVLPLFERRTKDVYDGRTFLDGKAVVKSIRSLDKQPVVG